LAEDEETLSNMVGVQEMLEDGDTEEFQKALDELDLSSSLDLSKAIRNLRSKIKKTKAKILAAANVNSDEIPKAAPQNEVRTLLFMLCFVLKVHLQVKVYKLLQDCPVPINSDEMDPWIVELKQKRQVIVNKRNARRQKRQDMAKRRTAAAQERMRIISQLAKKDKRDDTFGMKDEDWDVYKTIQKVIE
jgi:actin-related protein 5